MARTEENENISLLAHLMRRASAGDDGMENAPVNLETRATPDGGIIRTLVTREGIKVVEVTPPEGHFQTLESPHGRYISTPGCRRKPPEEVHEALRRFHQQDWGELASRHDHAANDHNFRTREGAVLAAYGRRGVDDQIRVHLGSRAEIPTVMRPEEY